MKMYRVDSVLDGIERKTFTPIKGDAMDHARIISDYSKRVRVYHAWEGEKGELVATFVKGMRQ